MRNPDDILIFLSVARMESISAAARLLGKDPATVGRKIQRLEEGLRVTLFAKSPRGYQLTEAGLRLLERAEGMETALIEIEDAFSQSGRQLQGRFRIGAPDGCAAFLLPQICAGLADEHPDLVLDVVASSREFDLLNREVDVSISVTPPKAKALVTTALADYKLHFAAARSLVEEQSDGLGNVPLISYIPELLVDPGLDIPDNYRTKEPSLRSNSVLVQWEWLKSGKGIGLVHDFAFRRDSTLVRVHPEFELDRSYYLNTRREDVRFKRMDALLLKLRQDILDALTP